MKRRIVALLAGLTLLAAAAAAAGSPPASRAPGAGYFDNTGRDDVLGAPSTPLVHMKALQQDRRRFPATR